MGIIPPGGKKYYFGKKKYYSGNETLPQQKALLAAGVITAMPCGCRFRGEQGGFEPSILMRQCLIAA